MSQIKQMILAVIIGIGIGIMVPLSFQFGSGIEKLVNFNESYISILNNLNR